MSNIVNRKSDQKQWLQRRRARGAALKIDSDLVAVPDGMERDMGGNGVLAPII